MAENPLDSTKSLKLLNETKSRDDEDKKPIPKINLFELKGNSKAKARLEKMSFGFKPDEAKTVKPAVNLFGSSKTVEAPEI